MQLSPAPSINDSRTKALMQIIHRQDTLDLTPLLVYRIPSTPAAALPFLAWQFDVFDPEWTLLLKEYPALVRRPVVEQGDGSVSVGFTDNGFKKLFGR